MIGRGGVWRRWLALASCFTVVACSRPSEQPRRPATGVTWADRGTPEETRRQLGRYKVGKPYKINGKWYYPQVDPEYDRTGVASWYGQDFHGLDTANGEVFDKEQMTAASPTLPLPSNVRVTNLENGRSAVVRVNDRGPFRGDRLIDLSQRAARELGYEQQGLAKVRVEFLEIAEVGAPPPDGPILASLEREPVDPGRPERGDVVRTTFIEPDAAPLGGPLVTETVTVTGPDRTRQRPTVVSTLAVDPPPLLPRLPAAVRTCVAGPQLVQVGAYNDTGHVRLAMARLGGIDRLRTEPVFINGRPAVRVRVGPVNDTAAGQRLLAKVRAQGYGDAYIVPLGPGSRSTRC